MGLEARGFLLSSRGSRAIQLYLGGIPACVPWLPAVECCAASWSASNGILNN